MSIELELKRWIGHMHADRSRSSFRDASPTQTMKAREDALKTVGIDPLIYSNLSAAYLGEGKFLQAAQMAEEAVRLSPTHPVYVLHLAQAKLAMGEYAQTVALCETMKSTELYTPELRALCGFAHYGKAAQCLKKGLLPMAVDESRKGLNDLRLGKHTLLECAHTLCGIGKHLLGTGLIDEATALATLASELDPTCVTLCEFLNLLDKINARIAFLVKRLFAVEEAIRLSAAKSLMAYESVLAARSFLALTEDPCPMLREASLVYLTRFRHPGWYDVLPLLYDEVEYVRSACAAYLGCSGEECAMDHLEIALNQEESTHVREDIRSAIKQISIEMDPFGPKKSASKYELVR